jgi:hypothetical protein
MLRTSSALRTFAGSLALAVSANVLAGNVAFPPASDQVALIQPGSPTCGSLEFADNRLTIATPNDPFFLIQDGDLFPLDGRSSIDLRVDPFSGAVLDGIGDEFYHYAISVESGTMQMVGSSVALGIPSDTTLLAGRVVGADFETSASLAGYNLFVDLDFVHPNILAAVGEVRSLQYSYGTSIWIIPGVTEEPWQTEGVAGPGTCFTASPFMALFSTPLDTSDPVTFKVDGLVEDVEQCEVIGDDNPKDYAISYTFDALTPDEDPSNRVGVYLSCDDTYGAPSGTETRVVDEQWQTSCVKIKVENNVLSDSNQTIDRYTVEALGREDVGGLILQVTDLDATMLSSDSLPVTPPSYQTGVGSPQSASTNMQVGNYCIIQDSDAAIMQVGDSDSDGIANSLDNCIRAVNPNQRDSDGDLFGNACDADFNNDFVINFIDLGQLRSDFFAKGDLETDLNSDGVVNFQDLGILRGLFFGPPGPSALAP